MKTTRWVLSVPACWVVLSLSRQASGQLAGEYASRYLHNLPPDAPGAVPADLPSLAKAFLHSKRQALDAEEADIGDLELVQSYKSEHNGITHLHFRQVVQGVQVLNGRVKVNVTRDGAVFTVGSHLVPGAEAKVDSLVPALSPSDALGLLADTLGIERAARDVKVVKEEGDAALKTTLEDPAVSRRAIPAELKLVPQGSRLRLAWSLPVYLPDRSDAFEALIDAEEGRELARQSFVAHATPQYKVFPIRKRGAPLTPPVESPAHGSQAEIVGGDDPSASPEGWVDLGPPPPPPPPPPKTLGNNASVFEDMGGTPYWASDSNCDFRFESLDLAFLNQSTDLSSYQDAALANLFYTVNVLHDVFHRYGFNEAAGNFQEDNYGRGGVGGNRVNVYRNNWGFNSGFQWADGTPELHMGSSLTSYKESPEVRLPCSHRRQCCGRHRRGRPRWRLRPRPGDGQ